jgi:hypothetical protein
MSDHPSDSELADMGDADLGPKEYRLAKTEHKPPEYRLPVLVKEALKKAETEAQEPPPLQKFQFTIRDMLILTAVVAFLMGLIVSISRGMAVYFMYSIFFLAMIAAWFAHGLWKSGYWRRVEIAEEEEPSDGAETTPAIEPAPQPLQYSVIDLFLLVSAFAFLMSLCTLLPGEHKLVNAAGIAGICTLLGLVWLAMSESRHPMFLLLWWLMFAMYLLSSVAVVVFG